MGKNPGRTFLKKFSAGGLVIEGIDGPVVVSPREDGKFIVIAGNQTRVERLRNVVASEHPIEVWDNVERAVCLIDKGGEQGRIAYSAWFKKKEPCRFEWKQCHDDRWHCGLRGLPSESEGWPAGTAEVSVFLLVDRNPVGKAASDPSAVADWMLSMFKGMPGKEREAKILQWVVDRPWSVDLQPLSMLLEQMKAGGRTQTDCFARVQRRIEQLNELKREYEAGD